MSRLGEVPKPNLIAMDFDKTICKTDLASVVETIVLTMAQDKEQFEMLPQSVKTEIVRITPKSIDDINESKSKWLNEIKEEINQDRGGNGDEQRKKELQTIYDLLSKESLSVEEQEKINTHVMHYAVARGLQSRTKEDADQNGDNIKKDINKFILSDEFKTIKLTPEYLNNALACVMPARNFLSKDLATDVVNGIKSLQKSEYKQLLDPKMVEIAKENPTVITSFNRNSDLMREILDQYGLKNVKIVYNSLQNCTGKEFAGCRPLFKFIHGLAVQESDGNTLETTNDINKLIEKLPDTSFAKRFNGVLGELAKSTDKTR